MKWLFRGAVLAQPGVKRLLSSDHFSVDGTLVEAWASMKSVRPKDGPAEPPAASSGTSTYTAATIQASSANETEFFNSLLGMVF